MFPPFMFIKISFLCRRILTVFTWISDPVMLASYMDFKITSCCCCMTAFVTWISDSLMFTFFMVFKIIRTCCSIFTCVTGIYHRMRAIHMTLKIDVVISNKITQIFFLHGYFIPRCLIFVCCSRYPEVRATYSHWSQGCLNTGCRDGNDTSRDPNKKCVK
jgi:hypothetical protein